MEKVSWTDHVRNVLETRTVPDNVHQLHVQQLFMYKKPEAASAVLGSWWWAVCRPKHVELHINMVKFDTLLHLVGFFFMNCTMMYGSMNVKPMVGVVTFFVIFLLHVFNASLPCSWGSYFNHILQHVFRSVLCIPLLDFRIIPHLWTSQYVAKHTSNVSYYLEKFTSYFFNPLKPEFNPICYLLALLGAHHFRHVSRIRVKLLTLRWLMSYIYGAPILDVSRSHTTTQHSR